MNAGCSFVASEVSHQVSSALRLASPAVAAAPEVLPLGVVVVVVDVVVVVSGACYVVAHNP